MDDVPWPLLMVPAETVQLYVGVRAGVPPLTFTEKVTGVPCSTSLVGQFGVIVGQTRSGTQSPQFAIVTVVVDEVIHPQPSSTSTDAV
jgi:hypothetical protein